MFYQAARFAFVPPLRLGFRLRIEGKMNIPSEGAAILASNHLSFLDHMLLPMATRRQIFYISKVEHFDHAFRRWFFHNIGVIPLKRGEGDQEAFERSAATLGEGNLFCIYPEGTRSRDGKLHKGHTGVARLAYLTGAPVVPVGMVGTFEALPKGRKFPRLTKCLVKLGAPMPSEKDASKTEDRAALRRRTDEVMRAIASLTGQEYVDAYQENPEVPSHRGSRSPEGGAKGSSG